MQSVKDILKKFDPLKDKYISREYQSFGVYLAQKLDDERHKSLYIKLAKTIHRPILEEALRFVIDSAARKKAALFMWKLSQLGVFKSVYTHKNEDCRKSICRRFFRWRGFNNYR